jgi:hypothetical protein
MADQAPAPSLQAKPSPAYAARHLVPPPAPTSEFYALLSQGASLNRLKLFGAPRPAKEQPPAAAQLAPQQLAPPARKRAGSAAAAPARACIPQAPPPDQQRQQLGGSTSAPDVGDASARHGAPAALPCCLAPLGPPPALQLQAASSAQERAASRVSGRSDPAEQALQNLWKAGRLLQQVRPVKRSLTNMLLPSARPLLLGFGGPTIPGAVGTAEHQLLAVRLRHCRCS